MPDSDDILKSQLRDGDLQAFRALFEKYYPRLVNYGFSITNNKEVSRGHVQEVFLKLWETRMSTIIRGSMKAYLYTAINHRALNWIRHEKIKRAYENEELHYLLSRTEQPDDVSPFLDAAISKAIDSLPVRALEVFTLTQLDGLTNKEAALRLGISVKTVENQITRSKKILRKKLSGYR